MPKTFISYSWTNADHEEWVINLATSLRENGVDVVLDKWDLREGHDAIRFMEQMVTDASVDRVVLVVDKKYSEKSNFREGGVGAEAQIISPELYGKRDQNKFVAVVKEADEEGNPYLPVYYKSRIYIDFTDPELFSEKFDQLLRWIFDKPLHQKPPLGAVPNFLVAEQKVVIPVNTKAKRAIDAVRSGHSSSLALTQEYLAELTSGMEAFRLSGGSDENFDEKVIESVKDFSIYLKQFLDVIVSSVRHQRSTEFPTVLHRFFEGLIPYLFRPNSATRWSRTDFDNYKILIHQMFLFSVAVLAKQERFDLVQALTGQDYYTGGVDEFSNISSMSFEVFRQFPQSIENRNKRLNLRRISLQADILVESSRTFGIQDNDLFQADFLLYLITEISAKDRFSRWYPVSLPYMDRLNRPFEAFVRATSKNYYQSMKPMLANMEIESFKKFLSEFEAGSRRAPSDGNWNSLNVCQLANMNSLGSKS